MFITIKCGSTPLQAAAAANSKECLALLLAHGADVTMTDEVSNSNYVFV